ncbi:tol-pal system protein YbgF [Methylobacter psychrophilus]|uniref:tol-pal system protein YbgF n=1 Tax=Methylobacter psychrophilus TaxID=96941 RepID=UPI0021D49FDD|nr:tol-pal system protein YbgF [Methylobacter psychrophilus]
MKKISLVMLLSACSSVYAELPPVVDHSLYPASATPAPASANAPSTNALYELMGRLEQMQAEVQRLTGKVDEQAYRIEELKKHQSTMYSDFDERLQGIENKGNGVDQPAAEGTPEAVGTGDVEVKPSDSSAAEPVSATEPVPANKPASVSAPAAAENQAPQPKSDGVQVSGPEKQEYYQAYDELRNGHTDQSITQFNTYLSKYPSGLYANNAQYWLGEAYRVKQDNDAARKAFNGVIEKYPDGAKVPDALLKLGYLEIELKNSAKAREYLTRVTTDYPKSPAALLAAKKLLKLNEVKN